MQKIMKFIEKHGLIIILMLIILATCTENMSKRMNEKKLYRQLDSIKTEIKLTKQELKKEIKVEGLKTSKRTLYDWNTVIRTTNRPDDIMIRYDNEIDSLIKK
jgi:hypothetical protein